MDNWFKIGMQFIKNRSVQIILICVVYFLFSSKLSIEVHQGFYTISVLIKDLLLWMLPITVTFFIAESVLSFEKKAPLFILTIVFFELFSNFISVWYGFGSAYLIAQNLQVVEPQLISETFNPLWRISLIKPIWWAPDKGTFVGIILGLVATFQFPRLRWIIQKGKKSVEHILTRFFSRLIPLFILGFVARMHQTQVFDQFFNRYAELIFVLLLFLIAYMMSLFWIGSGFSVPIFLKNIQNLLPAAGMAFSSGCSLSTMPWTIEGTAKNLKNPEFAQSVIPATTNIQQIGDCIVNSFLCFLIYLQFNGQTPPLSIWIPFCVVFVLARFATAAVIGGAIFIMLPIYEYYLHFTPEMIAMILAFNVILDPVITCANVVANGALCQIFEKVWRFVSTREQPSFSMRKK